MSSWASANFLEAATPASGRLQQRQYAWETLCAAGLAWQPGPAGSNDDRPAALTLSSPGEWTAEHWKDAALHILRVEETLRRAGWTLRDPSLHGIQFLGCRPLWVRQLALIPQPPSGWPGRTIFLDQVFRPLVERCQGRDSRWRAALRSWFARFPGARQRPDLAVLRECIERLPLRHRWSPWQSHRDALEPPGLASILAREEAAARGASLVYEWRGPRPAAPLRPVPGPAWIRFHQDEDAAAADYLEQRAARGCALPLWNRNGDPMSACPQRAEADLLIAAGRGNLPSSRDDLAAFARTARRMARAALVEFVPEPGGVPWEEFLDVLRACWRLLRVTETGAGRRLCVLERPPAALW